VTAQAVLLLAAALGGLVTAAIRPRGLLGLAVLLGASICAVAAVGLGLLEDPAGHGAARWMVAGLAGAWMLGEAAAAAWDHVRRATAAGVAAALLWPAAALRVWENAAALETTAADLVMAGALLGALVATGRAFASAGPALLLSGEGKLWLSISLFCLVALAAAPWAGTSSAVPLAVSAGGEAAGMPHRIGVLWQIPGSPVPLELDVVLATSTRALDVARTVLLATGAAAFAFVLVLAVTGADAARHLLTIAAVVAGLCAWVLPLLSLLGPTVDPRAAAEAATESLARMGPATSVAGITYGLDATVRPLALGLPPAAALLPAIGAAVFAGLGRPRAAPGPRPEPGLSVLRGALAVLGLACVAALSVSAWTAGAAGLGTSPWPLMLGALLASAATTAAASLGAAPHRVAGFGQALALTLLLVALLGPGAGWV
jgi:hypothetical protein